MKFSRTIKTSYKLIGKDKILSEGHFLDDYHNIKCTLVFSLPSLEIIDTTIEMGKLPKEICKTPLTKVQELKGLKIERGFRQKVKKLIGGKEGCIHVSDLIHEMGQGIVAFLRKMQMSPDGKELGKFPIETFYGYCIGLNPNK